MPATCRPMKMNSASTPNAKCGRLSRPKKELFSEEAPPAASSSSPGGVGKVSVIAFMVAYLFISIGYPTIFSLTLKGIKGSAAKTGSSALVMSIVGAALIPLLLGVIQDAAGIEIAILVMVPGFLFVAWYAFWGSKIGLKEA